MSFGEKMLWLSCLSLVLWVGTIGALVKAGRILLGGM